MNVSEGSTRVVLQTNRYTYSEEVAEEISRFAKKHEYDGRKEFKEAWQKWMEEPEIKKMIGDEVFRLTNNGFTGDITERMYKSARYYYRKKTDTADKEPEPRKEYEGLPRSVLRTIDTHINGEINQKRMDQDSGVINISAANSFTAYCKLHYDVITELLPENKEDIISLREEIMLVTERLKKTYKNRFYKIKVSMQEVK
jgi:hypothetical protein